MIDRISELPSDATSASMLFTLRTDPDSLVWTCFVERYQGLIEKWCRAWGLQECEGDDVAQDVLLSISKAMRQFEYNPTQSFRSWLKTVTHRAAMAFSKRNQRPGKADGGTGVLVLLNSVEARDDLTNRLQEEYDQELTELAMLRVKLTVRPRTWQAFQMTAMDGLSGAEVAGKLKMQVAHVYVAKSEVLKALRKEIQRLEPMSDLEPKIDDQPENRMPK